MSTTPPDVRGGSIHSEKASVRGRMHASGVPEAPSRAFHRALVCGWGLVIGVLAFGFVVAPFNEDVRSQFAAARQADYHGPFPGNIVEAWDIKPFGNRIIIYGLYRAAVTATSFGEKAAFERVVHGLCLGGIVAGIAVLHRFSRGGFRADAGLPSAAVALGAVSVLAVSHYVILQPEWFSSVILLAAIGLTLTEAPIAALAAGCVAAILLPLKGVTVLLVGVVPAAWVLMGLDWRRRVIPFLAGLAVGTALTVLFFVIHPQAWQDLLDASAYQNSVGGLAPLRRGLRTVGVGFGGAMKHAPMLYVGVCSTLLVAVAGVARRSFVDPLVLLATWGCAAVVILIQGKWFAYHYGVAIVPALLAVGVWSSGRYMAWNGSLSTAGRWRLVACGCLGSVALAAITWRYAPEHRGELPAILAATSLILAGLVHFGRVVADRQVTPLIAAVLTVAGWAAFGAPWTEPAKMCAAAGEAQAAHFMGLDAVHDLSAQPSVLFLEGGEASYHITPRSALRWIYPLPLQRVHSNPALVESAVHARALGQALGYEGRFIVIDATWMRSDQRLVPSLSEKIDREYEVIDAADLLQDHGGRHRYLLLRRR